MRSESRRTWRNHTGNQAVEPLRVCWPESLGTSSRSCARPSGSTSPCARSARATRGPTSRCAPGIVAETTRLQRVLPLEAMRDDPGAVPRRGRDEDPHAQRRAGAARPRAREPRRLRRPVDRRASSRPRRTARGCGSARCATSSARSTSSRGDGTVHRIERADGPTDPADLAALHPDWQLHQDDEWYRAAVCGMGCLGLIYAITLAVVPAFELTERRVATTWDGGARGARATSSALRAHLHYEVYLSPYAQGGRALVTTRDLPDGDRGSRHRNRLLELFAGRRITYKAINLVTDLFPRITPRLLDMAITGLARKAYTNDELQGVQHRRGQRGAGLLLGDRRAGRRGGHAHPGGRADHRAGRAAPRRRRRATTPRRSRCASWRASDAHLAMMHGPRHDDDRADRAVDTEGGYELLGRYEDALYALGGPPALGAGQHAHRQPRLPALARHVPGRPRPLAGGRARSSTRTAASTGRSPSGSGSRARGNDRPRQSRVLSGWRSRSALRISAPSSARAGWRACTARPGPTGPPSRSSSCAPTSPAIPTSGAASRARCARSQGITEPPSRAGAGERRARRHAVPGPAGAAPAARCATGSPRTARSRVDALVRLCRHVAQGLGALHARGIVHRDVKPANILFDAARRARTSPTSGSSSRTRRQRAHAPGPAGRHARRDGARAAPRRARSAPAADVYALGCVLWEAARGRAAVRPTATGSTRCSRTCTTPPPRSPADVPRGVADVIVHALAKDPADRPPTARTLALLLRAGAA